MDSKRVRELAQDAQRQGESLDERYGKIGISAVAAAVQHQGGRRDEQEPRYGSYYTD